MLRSVHELREQLGVMRGREVRVGKGKGGEGRAGEGRWGRGGEGR